MQQISVAEASKQLAQLVDAALNGEDIVIIKDAQLAVKLNSVQRMPVKQRPKFGSAKGLLVMSDDFDDPLEDFREYME
jgi:antitoxin (DNA-binding transcriptional repressor) of toxin-antitoxin stability system